MSDVPITTAHLAGLFVSCILYGFHIVSFAFTLRSLAWAKSRWGDINVLFLVVACFLLGNASFDLILDFQQAVKAFVYNEAGGGPLGVFENISNWANVTKSLSVVVQTLVGDAMLIYRCFIIYSRSYLVILLPVILWLGGFAATIWVIYLEATLHSRVLVTAKQLRPSGSLFWGLTIALNVITTSLLVWRIWRLDRRNKSGTLCGDFVPETRRLLRDVVRIIVESGLLYTASALATFVIFICKSNAIYVITGAEIQIVGIAYNLIIIRASTLASCRREQSAIPGTLSFVRSPPLQSRSDGETAFHAQHESTDTMEIHVVGRPKLISSKERVWDET